MGEPRPTAAQHYDVALADGSHWRFIADEGAKDWLAELALIGGFETAPSQPTHWIHFSTVPDLKTEQLPKQASTESPARSSWQVYTHGGIHRIWRHRTQPKAHIQLVQRFLDHREIRYINMASALREIHRHGLVNGGSPLHGALAALDGRGTIICAAGGVGKSTCCRRLPAPWEPLCDDQSLVIKDAHGNLAAHPLPTWSEYLFGDRKQTWRLGRSVALKAVFFLEASPHDEVAPIAGAADRTVKLLEAAQQVWAAPWARLEVTEKRQQAHQLLDNLSAASRQLPAFHLRATLEGTFWQGMATALDGQVG